MWSPLQITLVGVGSITLVALAAECAMRMRGDADIYLDTAAAHSLQKQVLAPGHVVLRATIPFANRGRQQGAVVDCTGRLLPLGDRYRGLAVDVRVNNLSLPRDDGYFEAIMYKKKETLELGVEVHVRGEDAEARLEKIPRMTLEFRFSFYMRSPLRYRRAEFEYPVAQAELVPPPARPKSVAAAPSTEKATPAPERQPGRAIPIRTHLLTPDDDFVDVVEKYALPMAKPGDIVAVAESALAIMQGRLYHVEDMHPRWLARKFCRIFDADSSLSTPYGLEAAFRVCGTTRILLAIAAGVAGKAVGRSGDFYRVAGPDVATIDDSSGTLPPFDKHVVLGPSESRKVVDLVKTRFGIEAAVVDANDLKKCMVVAVSDPSLEKEVVASLIDNPQGNAGEQTPIVLIPRTA